MPQCLRDASLWESPVTLRFGLPLLGLLLFSGLLGAQTTDDDYRVYRDHPRLFLTPQRLRLLKRERDRQSVRWQQFAALIQGAAQMSEPGFAGALYYAIVGDAAQGRRAVDWALGPGADLRQLALVYDWCQPALHPDQLKALRTKIQRLVEQKPTLPDDLAAVRDRVLAVIAIADDTEHGEDKLLRPMVEQWWRGRLAPALLDGHRTISPDDVYALVEILHAVRDNLKIEMQEAAPAYFRELPRYQILANYPAPLASSENQYAIPVYKGAGQPNLERAALARTAGLSLVAYDDNALQNQYLQGWLMQDRFMLRSAFAAPYEFLWANPYQPGLSYVQLPLLFHDQHSGALFVRSSWDDDAVWLGVYQGEAQLFRDGHITVLSHSAGAPGRVKPVPIGEVSVVPGANPVQFSADSRTFVVLGLKPQRKYAVEIDDEELREAATDPAGTLIIEEPAARATGVRVHEVPARGD
jgi:hypothetical protein